MLLEGLGEETTSSKSAIPAWEEKEGLKPLECAMKHKRKAAHVAESFPLQLSSFSSALWTPPNAELPLGWAGLLSAPLS